MSDIPPVDRQKKIARLRRQIAAGEYETPEKITAAVDAMLADLADGREPDGQDLPAKKRAARPPR